MENFKTLEPEVSSLGSLAAVGTHELKLGSLSRRALIPIADDTVDLHERLNDTTGDMTKPIASSSTLSSDRL